MKIGEAYVLYGTYLFFPDEYQESSFLTWEGFTGYCFNFEDNYYTYVTFNGHETSIRKAKDSDYIKFLNYSLEENLTPTLEAFDNHLKVYKNKVEIGCQTFTKQELTPIIEHIIKEWNY